MNVESNFIKFEENGFRFELSQQKISILMKHIHELKSFWSLPLNPDEEYRIQPPGYEWNKDSLQGWRLIHILTKAKEINLKLLKKYRLSEEEFKKANAEIAKLIKDKVTSSAKQNDNTLHEWQQKALQSWLDAGKRGIIEAATGTGKTWLAIACIEKFIEDSPNGLVCIIVPRQPIFDMWQRELRAKLSIPAKRYCRQGNGYKDKINNNTKIIVAMQQTTVNKSDNIYGCVLLRQLIESSRDVFFVFDEAHHLGANKTLERVIRYIPENFCTLGLSATPFRETGEMDEVYRCFDCEDSTKPIYSYSLTQAVEDEILSNVKQINYSVSLNMEEETEYNKLCENIKRIKRDIINNGIIPIAKFGELKINRGDIAFLENLKRKLEKLLSQNNYYSVKALLDKISELKTTYVRRRKILNQAEAKWELLRFLLLKDDWRRLLLKGRWILFHEEKTECEKTANILKEFLGNEMVRIHHSKIIREERENALKELIENNFSCLCAVKTLDEGIDIPDLSGVIIISGSNSKRQQIQRCGRALRRAANKPFAYLISFLAKFDEETNLTGERLSIHSDEPSEKWEIKEYFYEDNMVVPVNCPDNIKGTVKSKEISVGRRSESPYTHEDDEPTKKSNKPTLVKRKISGRMKKLKSIASSQKRNLKYYGGCDYINPTFFE